MRCPKCHCEETSPTGMCLWCGYQVYSPSAESKSAAKENLYSPDQTASGDFSASAETDPGKPEQTQDPSDAPDSSNSEILSSDFSQTQTPNYSMDETASAESADLYQSQEFSEHDNRWKILLFRAFADFMDLAIIALITGSLIIASGLLWGPGVLDFPSILNFFALLLLIYFLYSFFFLVISGCTIGMMAAGLHVVNKRGANPGVFQILVRCFGYLISILFAGIGLIWAFLDSEGQCLHDRLTNTRVVRTLRSR
jgi:uncharacterized RDD family membrane protein YckC